jgi:HTH-type transcriptional regulator, quorum sensing regulator NprR
MVTGYDKYTNERKGAFCAMSTHIGEKIRKFRKESGLTQTQLAEGIVTPSMICQIEAGKATPSYAVLEAIAERLERPLSDLLQDTQPQGKHKATLLLAQSLIRNRDYEHACSMLESLLQQTPLQVPRDDVELTLANCYIHLARYEEAQSLLDEFLTKSMYLKNIPAAFRCLLYLAKLARRSEKKQVALYHLRKAYALMQQDDKIPLEEKIELLHRLGSLYQELGRAEEAHQCYQMAFEWGQSALNEETRGRMYMEKSLQALRQMNYEEACDFAEKANALYENMHHTLVLTDVLRSFSCMLAKRGNLSEAILRLQECLYQYKRLGDSSRVAATELELAKMYMEQGMYFEAEQALGRAEPLLERSTFEQGLYYHLSAMLYMRTSRYDDVLSLLSKALHIYQQHGAYDACAQVIEATNVFCQTIWKKEQPLLLA